MVALPVDDADSARRVLNPAHHPDRSQRARRLCRVRAPRSGPDKLHEDVVPRPQALHEVD